MINSIPNDEVANSEGSEHSESGLGARKAQLRGRLRSYRLFWNSSCMSCKARSGHSQLRLEMTDGLRLRVRV